MKTLASSLDEREIIEFTQQMIRTPSLSGEEANVAEQVAAEMNRLGYDRVEIDDRHNVIGYINPGGRPMVMLNGHIDHAGVGQMKDPFSALIVDGSRFGSSGDAIYGRGACDMKGAVAAMVHAAATLKGRPGLKGGAVVTAVALEEKGEGEGTKHVLSHGVRADFAVCGEATGMRVNVGHRGKFNVRVTTRGRTSHACSPDRGINAIYKMGPFLGRLQTEYTLPSHAILGQCTCTVVDIMASPGWTSPTVPDSCSVIVDRRTLPGETEEQVLAELKQIAARVAEKDPQFRAHMEIVTRTSPMWIDPSNPIVHRVEQARSRILGDQQPVGAWLFGTDAPYIIEQGIPCVGFGPGNETFAHSEQDHVPIKDVIDSARVYAQILEDQCL